MCLASVCSAASAASTLKLTHIHNGIWGTINTEAAKVKSAAAAAKPPDIAASEGLRRLGARVSAKSV